MDFNNRISFKGYEMKHLSVADIVLEMERFVQNLPVGSSHLKFIRIAASMPKEFKLSFGQINCLGSTLDLIVEKLKATPEETQQTTISPRVRQQRQERVIQEVDLANIQEIWNLKLKAALSKHNLAHNSFPIVKSSTQNFPYKFFIKCPKCNKDLQVTITRDEARNGVVKQPHYRFFGFTSHVINCMKK